MSPHNKNLAAQELLRRFRRAPAPKVTISGAAAVNAIAWICRTLGVSVDLVKSEIRDHHTAAVRFIISHHLHERYGLRHEDIGRLIDRHRTTIINACKQYDALVSVRDKEFLSMLEKVKMI